ncbi:hydrolase [Parvularcula lutaonensis]|uniref:Hydrolase n=1 Tax=Parvularcula lutaonensis TaxID=491923 RepID=A0ABV7MFZ2_9PROT|nr:hydrolase [Parvularcula lutaonensis]GGY53329.1 acetylornithine deacetylase [Parvularcula lutaonensis]
MPTSDFDSILGSLDGLTEQMTDRTMRWSAINSGTANLEGLAQMADEVTAAFTEAGFEAERVPPAPVTEVNDKGDVVEIVRGEACVFRANPTANRRILMTGHLDTVFPKNSHFQTPVIRDDGTLHGPGVADMKGGICVMLEAARAFLNSPYADNIGIDVILNADEETGSHASAALLARMAKEADIGMVYEPALPDGTLAGARAGSGHYTFTVRGLAAHAGREFDKGKNAILGAARLMLAIDELNGVRDGATINIGVIDGGVATNVVPDTCVVRINVRARKTEDLNWVDAEIRRVHEETDLGDGITAELHGGVHRPVKEMKGGTAELFQLVKKAGGDLGIGIDWAPTGGCCDGNNLADAGLPNVDTLGVVGGKIHSDQEYAHPESFVPRAKLSLLIMLLLASGKAPWPKRLDV